MKYRFLLMIFLCPVLCIGQQDSSISSENRAGIIVRGIEREKLVEYKKGKVVKTYSKQDDSIFLRVNEFLIKITYMERRTFLPDVFSYEGGKFRLFDYEQVSDLVIEGTKFHLDIKKRKFDMKGNVVLFINGETLKLSTVTLDAEKRILYYRYKRKKTEIKI